MNKFEIIRRIMEVLSQIGEEDLEMFELVLYKGGEIVYDEIFPEEEDGFNEEEDQDANTEAEI